MHPAFSDSLIEFLLINGNISEDQKEYPKKLQAMNEGILELVLVDNGVFSMKQDIENLAVESTDGHIFVVKEFPRSEFIPESC